MNISAKYVNACIPSIFSYTAWENQLLNVDRSQIRLKPLQTLAERSEIERLAACTSFIPRDRATRKPLTIPGCEPQEIGYFPFYLLLAPTTVICWHHVHAVQ